MPITCAQVGNSEPKRGGLPSFSIDEACESFTWSWTWDKVDAKNSLYGPDGGVPSPCAASSRLPTWGHSGSSLEDSCPWLGKEVPTGLSFLTCPLNGMPSQNSPFYVCLRITPLPRCLLQSPQLRHRGHHSLSR